jgi:hypothetical protein
MAILTIYFHNDFDGIIAAALFLRINKETQLIGADGISFKPVDYEQKNTWLKTQLQRPNVVIDFLYHPKAEWWFDHHVSTFLNDKHKAKYINSEKQFWDVSYSSCAALIKQNLQSQCSLFMGNDEYLKVVDDFKEWIQWSDIIDNAKYESPTQIVELKHPCLQINSTLSYDVEAQYLEHLIIAAKMYPPEDVVRTQSVKDKIQKIFLLQEKHLGIFKNAYKIMPQMTVFFDYVKNDIPFQRYFTYYYEPDALYSIGLYKRNGKIAISVGKNPWLDFASKNVGEICHRFGGGGRINVGSILISDYSKALAVVNSICEYLST